MLGRVFLKEKGSLIFNKIINKNVKLIELASGYGSLTKFIIKTKLKITCLELDNKTSKKFKSEFKRKVFFINCNILNYNFKYLGKTIILGNIPYYISKRIIKFIFLFKNIKVYHLMVQEELLDFFKRNGNFNIFKLFFLKKSFFTPKIKVNSFFLKIIPIRS